MVVTLKNIYRIFFFIGVFFIPVNSYEGIGFLGEYKREGAIVLFLISFLFFTLDILIKGRLKIPFKSIIFQMLLVFVGWLILSTLLNTKTINLNYIKGTSGFNRFFRQFFSLLIVLYLFVISYNVFANFSTEKIFLILRKIFLWSFVLVSGYGFLEILVVYFNILGLKQVLLLFNYFPFTNVYLDFKFRRISSFSLEPPFLAIYLMTIAGWMFSYIVSSKKVNIKKFIPTILVFILTFFSGSRTALIVITIQFFVFLGTIFTINKKFRIIINRFLIGLGVLSILLFSVKGKDISKAVNEKLNSLDFTTNMLKNTSNRTRFGIQYTSVLIFTENPIIGVGFGQQAFQARGKYPKWATENNYEFRMWYLNDSVKSFPPGYNIYTRLLAETGIIGFLIFVFLLILLLLQSKKLIKKKQGIEKIISVVLLVSFTGFIINWMQIDSFRIFGFWICLALIIKQTKERTLSHE